MDMRGGQSKKSDEAGKGIKDMGKSEFFFLFVPCYSLSLSLYGLRFRVDVGVDLIY
jgi:hypothetical protein